MNNLSLNLLVGAKSMPQILKVLILVKNFGTWISHLVDFYVLLKIINFLHEQGVVKPFFHLSEGGSNIFFNIFGISPIHSFSFYCYAPKDFQDECTQKMHFLKLSDDEKGQWRKLLGGEDP